MRNIVWTLFVLDLDGTYDHEELDSIGVAPSVYLIPLDRQKDVEHYAEMAGRDFHSAENLGSDFCIGDYFEERMADNGVDFQHIGDINLTFGERQTDYLADYIPREIV